MQKSWSRGTVTVADIIAGGINRERSLERRLSPESSGVLVRFDFYRERFDMQDSGLDISERDLGSAFILGHDSKGLLGINSPQSYLGSDFGPWKKITINGLDI